MSRPAALLLLSALALPACEGDVRLRGEWSGACILDTDLGLRQLPFTLDITAQQQGRISGTGTYQYDGYEFAGDVDGTVEGNDVLFDLVGIYGGYTVTLMGDGELEDNGDVEGDCGFFDLPGELDMER